MLVTRRERLTAPFVLKQADLDELARSIGQHFPHVTCEARCADNLTRVFDNIEELTNYPNPEGREIRELTLSARSDDFRSRISLSLASDLWSNVYLMLDANEETAIALSGRIMERLSAMRPWYAWITTIKWPFWIFVPQLLVLGTMILYVSRLPGFDLPSFFSFFRSFPWGKMTLAIWLKSLFAGYGPIAIGALFYVISRHVFPLGVFAIGHGLRRHQTLEVFRTVFVGGFVVSLIAGVVVTVALWH